QGWWFKDLDNNSDLIMMRHILRSSVLTTSDYSSQSEHIRHHGVVIWHVDFRNAFQNGGADFHIFIRQPPGFTNPQYPHHVLFLHKSLYGLKQASRIWFMILCQLILDLGFTECQTDRCTFYSNDRHILIAVYVEDHQMIGKLEDNER